MGFRAPARTLAVGAACGAIAVLGLFGAGQVTNATLRTYAADTAGRHPAGVTFSIAPEEHDEPDLLFGAVRSYSGT